MAYSPKVKRQAKRLGIRLPEGEVDCTPSEWSSDGYETLFEGPCKLDYVQGGWTVKLRRSGRKAGYRTVQRDLSLEQAVELARFLAKPANRRAYRGLAPKERKAAKVTTYDDLTEEDSKAALREMLAKANGGNVSVS
jgi:hypothetical protein